MLGVYSEDLMYREIFYNLLDLKLRKVSVSDWDFILYLRNKFYPNFYKQDKPISSSEHYDYMEKQKSNQNFHDWIIEINNTSIGYVRILDSDIGIIVDEKFQKKGYASKALSLAEHEAHNLGIKKLVALIKIENESSRRIFEKNDFQPKMYWLEKNI